MSRTKTAVNLSGELFKYPVTVLGGRYARLKENTTRRENRSGQRRDAFGPLTNCGFSDLGHKRSALAKSRRYVRGDLLGGRRRARQPMYDTTSTAIVTDRRPTRTVVPPVPFRREREGNKIIARPRSGNTSCSPRSPHSARGETRTREATPLYYLPPHGAKGTKGTRGDHRRPVLWFPLFPSTQRVKGTGGTSEHVGGGV